MHSIQRFSIPQNRFYGIWSSHRPPASVEVNKLFIKISESKKCRITVGGGEEDGAADGYLIDDSIANENFRSYEEIKTGAQKNRRGRKR